MSASTPPQPATDGRPQDGYTEPVTAAADDEIQATEPPEVVAAHEVEAVDGIPIGVAGLMPGAMEFPFDPWNFRDTVDPNPRDLAGFHVEALDGRIGKVDAANHTTDDGYLIVDTGPWIFGRTVVLPAGTVNQVDRNARVVYIDQTKEQVKASPELGHESLGDQGSRTQIDTYYRGTYPADESRAPEPAPMSEPDR